MTNTSSPKLVATHFEIARHILGSVVSLQVNGFPIPSDDVEHNVREQVRLRMIALSHSGQNLPGADIVIKALSMPEFCDEEGEDEAGDIHTIIDKFAARTNEFIGDDDEHEQTSAPLTTELERQQLLRQIRALYEKTVEDVLKSEAGYYVAVDANPANVPVPFMLADLEAIVIGTCHAREEDDALMHPMDINYVLKDGRRFDFILEPDNDETLAAQPGAQVKTVPAFPAYDPTAIWHRILGPSRFAYVVCRLITGATDRDIADEVKQEPAAIAKIRAEIAPLIDPEAVMPSYWPTEFAACVSDPREAAILCHCFGGFPTIEQATTGLQIEDPSSRSFVTDSG